MKSDKYIHSSCWPVTQKRSLSHQQFSSVCKGFDNHMHALCLNLYLYHSAWLTFWVFFFFDVLILICDSCLEIHVDCSISPPFYISILFSCPLTSTVISVVLLLFLCSSMYHELPSVFSIPLQMASHQLSHPRSWTSLFLKTFLLRPSTYM